MTENAVAQSKQDVVVGLVQAGTYSREELRKIAGCTSGALATYISGMRNAAKFTGATICPIETTIEIDGVEKKVMTVVTFDEYESARAEATVKATTKAPAKSPEVRLADAETRINRCTKAVDSAKGRLDENGDDIELDLRHQKAVIELKLADIELDRAQALVEAAGVPELEDDSDDDDAPDFV